MGKTAIDAPRSNLFLVEPEKLTLITDKAHKLYDPRVELPLNEGLVLSMVNGGAFDPLMVFKDGERLVVIDGRQRVKAGVEANKQRAAKNLPPLRLEVIVKKGDERTIFALQSAANENRAETSDLERAQLLQRLMAFGFTEVEAGGVLGLDKTKAKRIHSLLDLDAKVQAAMRAEKISTTGALQLVGLEREKQVVELDKLIEEAGGKRVRVKAASKAGKKASGKAASENDAPTKKEVAKFWEYMKTKPMGNEAMEHLRARLVVADVLEWVLTGKEGTGFITEFRAVKVDADGKKGS